MNRAGIWKRVLKWNGSRGASDEEWPRFLNDRVKGQGHCPPDSREFRSSRNEDDPSGGRLESRHILKNRDYCGGRGGMGVSSGERCGETGTVFLGSGMW